HLFTRAYRIAREALSQECDLDERRFLLAIEIQALKLQPTAKQHNGALIGVLRLPAIGKMRLFVYPSQDGHVKVTARNPRTCESVFLLVHGVNSLLSRC